MFRSLSDNTLDDVQMEALREEILSQPDVNVLVAYFSYSGTTRNVATALSEKTGGDLFEITPQKGYSNVYMESNSEIRSNARPALTDTVENMEEYDIVFVGYPVWWHATPAPINTFLESYDLTGKLIIPFCTSGGSAIDKTIPTFLNSCDGLTTGSIRNRRTASKAVLYYFKKARIFHGENKYPLPQQRKAAAGISALRSMRLWDDPYPGVRIFAGPESKLLAGRSVCGV